MILQPKHIGYLSVWSGKIGKFDITPFTRKDLESADAETQRNVQAWLNGINEPWSDTAVSYTIHPSYESGVIPDNERWICDYSSIVYDGIEAHVRVCASTPQIAFQKCIELIQELLQDYYIEPEEADE